MIAILLAVLLFGLVHPVSKLFLDVGLPFSFFCISYVGIRLVVQLPVLFSSRVKSKASPMLLGSLVLFGFLGAGLQVFEFKGIQHGVSPGTVTFLVFSYPLWLAIFGAIKSPSQKFKYLSGAILTLVGAFLILEGSFKELQGQSLALLYPVLASLFMAFWIVLAGRIRKMGLQAKEISVVYDLVTMLILIPFFLSTLESDASAFVDWFSPWLFVLLAAYSVFIGLIPNILFYHGSKEVPAYSAGMVMAFEPVVSSIYSSFVWDHSFSRSFILGAILILVANLPVNKIWTKLLSRAEVLSPGPATSLK